MKKLLTSKLWKRVQKGDTQAFGELYNVTVDALYNYGISLTLDKQLVQDSIQEIFVTIWLKKNELTIHSNLKSYLFTSLRRQIILSLNKQHKTTFVEEVNVQKIDNLSTELENSEHRLALVRKEISKLSKREKEAILLKFDKGLVYEDISKVMNLQRHAVYKLISRGLKKIKAQLC